MLQQVGVALFKKDQLVFGLHFLYGLKPELFPRSLWSVFIGNDLLDAHNSSMTSDKRKRKEDSNKDENENSISVNTISIPSWASPSPALQAKLNALAMVKEGRELIKK